MHLSILLGVIAAVQSIVSAVPAERPWGSSDDSSTATSAASTDSACVARKLGSNGFCDTANIGAAQCLLDAKAACCKDDSCSGIIVDFKGLNWFKFTLSPECDMYAATKSFTDPIPGAAPFSKGGCAAASTNGTSSKEAGSKAQIGGTVSSDLKAVSSGNSTTITSVSTTNSKAVSDDQTDTALVSLYGRPIPADDTQCKAAVGESSSSVAIWALNIPAAQWKCRVTDAPADQTVVTFMNFKNTDFGSYFARAFDKTAGQNQQARFYMLDPSDKETAAIMYYWKVKHVPIYHVWKGGKLVSDAMFQKKGQTYTQFEDGVSSTLASCGIKMARLQDMSPPAMPGSPPFGEQRRMCVEDSIQKIVFCPNADNQSTMYDCCKDL